MLKQMCTKLLELWRDRAGAVALEYGLILVLIVLVLISFHEFDRQFRERLLPGGSERAVSLPRRECGGSP